MPKNDDDGVDLVILDEPPKHAPRPRWRFLHRPEAPPKFGFVGAFGVTSLALGMFSLVTVIFLFFVPWYSWFNVPFSGLGVVCGLLAVFFSVSKRRHGPGLGFAFVGMCCSLVSLGVSFGLIHFVQPKIDDIKQGIAAADARNEMLVGEWRRTDDENLTIQFTSHENLIQRRQRGDDVREEMGSYRFSSDYLIVEDPNHRTSRHKFELINEDELMIARSNYSSGIRVDGRWQRTVSWKEQNAQPEVKSPNEIQLEKLVESQRRIITLSREYAEQKDEIVNELKAMSQGDRDDDRWQVLAHELKTLISQIKFLNEQQIPIDKAILRLHAVIRSDERAEKLSGVIVPDEELFEIRKRVYELDDHLKKIADDEKQTELGQEIFVEEEIKKLKEASENQPVDNEN